MNFVLIDDHPFILEGYGNIIKQNYPQSKIVTLTNCTEVYNYFDTDSNAIFTDIVLLDFNIPA